MVNQKSSLSYFYLDTDMELDDKIRLVEAKHGAIGFAVIVKMLIKIYGDKGYYYLWDDKAQLLFSDRVRVDQEKVKEIINDALEWGLFNKKKFKKYKILTSERIQKHYIEACSRRKKVPMYAEYMLNGIDDYISKENVVILDQNDGILKQMKGYDMKGNDASKKDENKNRFLDYVLLTDKEYKKLTEKLGKAKTDYMIDRLNNYIGSKGRQYKSHYHTILVWVGKDEGTEPNEGPKIEKYKKE